MELRRLVKAGIREVSLAKTEDGWFLTKGTSVGVFMPFPVWEFRLHSHSKRNFREMGIVREKYPQPNPFEEETARNNGKIEYVLSDKGLCAFGGKLDKPVMATWKELSSVNLPLIELEKYFIEKTEPAPLQGGLVTGPAAEWDDDGRLSTDDERGTTPLNIKGIATIAGFIIGWACDFPGLGLGIGLFIDLVMILIPIARRYVKKHDVGKSKPAPIVATLFVSILYGLFSGAMARGETVSWTDATPTSTSPAKNVSSGFGSLQSLMGELSGEEGEAAFNNPDEEDLPQNRPIPTPGRREDLEIEPEEEKDEEDDKDDDTSVETKAAEPVKEKPAETEVADESKRNFVAGAILGGTALAIAGGFAGIFALMEKSFEATRKANEERLARQKARDALIVDPYTLIKATRETDQQLSGSEEFRTLSPRLKETVKEELKGVAPDYHGGLISWYDPGITSQRSLDQKLDLLRDHDLFKAHLLLRFLRERENRKFILDEIQRDIKDKSAESGGVFKLQDGKISSFPLLSPLGTDKSANFPRDFDYTNLAATYHCHSNGESMPSGQDAVFACGNATTNFVFTPAKGGKFNIKLFVEYRHRGWSVFGLIGTNLDPVILDLGTYSLQEGPDENVTCGTICESEHEGSVEALNEQLKRQFEGFKGVLGIREDRDLTEKEADKALVRREAAKSGRWLKRLRASIREEAGIPDEISIFFSVPEGGTELFWVREKWGAGHFNREGNRIHISLPFAIKSGEKARALVAKHELAHIQRGVHEEIPGYLVGVLGMAKREDTIHKRRESGRTAKKGNLGKTLLEGLSEDAQIRLAGALGIGDGKKKLSKRARRWLSRRARVAEKENIFEMLRSTKKQASKRFTGARYVVKLFLLKAKRLLAWIAGALRRKPAAKPTSKTSAPKNDSARKRKRRGSPGFLWTGIGAIILAIVMFFAPAKSAQAQTEEFVPPQPNAEFAIGTEVDGSLYTDHVDGAMRYPNTRVAPDGTVTTYNYDPSWNPTVEFVYYPDGTLERTDHAQGGSPETMIPGWKDFQRGANLPWGNYGFDIGLGANGESHEGFSTPAKRAELLRKLSPWKGGYVRVFLFCDLRSGITFDGSGMPTGFTKTGSINHVFDDMDALVEAAEMLGIKLFAVLLDRTVADGVLDESGYPVGEHPDLITDPAKRAALLTLIADFVRRYANNDVIAAWDVMNEPSICVEKTGITIPQIEAFLAAIVDMIRIEDPNTKVTVGAKNRGTASYWTGLDLHFYSIHYYDYMSADYPLDEAVSMDKPVIYTEVEPTNILWKIKQIYEESEAEGAFFWEDAVFVIPNAQDIHGWDESTEVVVPPAPDYSSGGGCSASASASTGSSAAWLLLPWMGLAIVILRMRRSASTKSDEPAAEPAEPTAKPGTGQEKPSQTGKRAKDFGISSEGEEVFTRAEHEALHEKGKFAGVMESIAKEIGAKKRRDGRYDLRKVVERRPDQWIKTSHGEIRIDGYTRILVIIDDRFEKDHAGRGEYAVYARNEPKAQHELRELHSWAVFAVQKGIIIRMDTSRRNLGRELRKWMNDRSISREELLRRQRLIIDHARWAHKQGLRVEIQAQEIEDVIPSTQDSIVFLLGTDEKGISAAFTKGLALKDRTLESTALSTFREKLAAKGIYDKGFTKSSHVLVIEIPIGESKLKEKDFIPSRYVKGYISRKDEQFIPNDKFYGFEAELGTEEEISLDAVLNDMDFPIASEEDSSSEEPAAEPAEEKGDAHYMAKVLEVSQRRYKNGQFTIVLMLVNNKTGEEILLEEREKIPEYGIHNHLEPMSLNEAIRRGWDPRDCTMYVSVENCYHCAKAERNNFRVGRVVIGYFDPTQKGRSFALLKSGGIPVEIIKDEALNKKARDIIEGFMRDQDDSYIARFTQEDFEQAERNPREILEKMEKNTYSHFDYDDMFDWAAYCLLKDHPAFSQETYPQIYTVNADKILHEKASFEEGVSEVIRQLMWGKIRINSLDNRFKFVLAGNRENCKKIAEEIVKRGVLTADRIYIWTDLDSDPVPFEKLAFLGRCKVVAETLISNRGTPREIIVQKMSDALDLYDGSDEPVGTGVFFRGTFEAQDGSIIVPYKDGNVFKVVRMYHDGEALPDSEMVSEPPMNICGVDYKYQVVLESHPAIKSAKDVFKAQLAQASPAAEPDEPSGSGAGSGITAKDLAVAVFLGMGLFAALPWWARAVMGLGAFIGIAWIFRRLLKKRIENRIVSEQPTPDRSAESVTEPVEPAAEAETYPVGLDILRVKEVLETIRMLAPVFHEISGPDDLVTILQPFIETLRRGERRVVNTLLYDEGGIKKLRQAVKNKAAGKYVDMDHVDSLINEVLSGQNMDQKAIDEKIYKYWEKVYINGGESTLSLYQKITATRTLLYLQLYPDDIPVFRSVFRKFAGFPGTNGIRSNWALGESGLNHACHYMDTGEQGEEPIIIKTTIGELRKNGIIIPDPGSITGNAILLVHRSEDTRVEFEEVKPPATEPAEIAAEPTETKATPRGMRKRAARIKRSCNKSVNLMDDVKPVLARAVSASKEKEELVPVDIEVSLLRIKTEWVGQVLYYVNEEWIHLRRDLRNSLKLISLIAREMGLSGKKLKLLRDSTIKHELCDRDDGLRKKIFITDRDGKPNYGDRDFDFIPTEYIQERWPEISYDELLLVQYRNCLPRFREDRDSGAIDESKLSFLSVEEIEFLLHTTTVTDDFETGMDATKKLARGKTDEKGRVIVESFDEALGYTRLKYSEGKMTDKRPLTALEDLLAKADHMLMETVRDLRSPRDYRDPSSDKPIYVYDLTQGELTPASKEKEELVPVDIEVDLSLITRKNMEEYADIWASLILSCAENKNVNFHFGLPDYKGSENIPAGIARDMANAPTWDDLKDVLKGKIASKAPLFCDGLKVEEFFQDRINTEIKPGAIRVPICSKTRLEWMRKNKIPLGTDQYPVALDEFTTVMNNRVAFRNFEAALAIGLCKAALVIAKRRGGGELDELKSKIIEKLKNLYKIFKVRSPKFTINEDTLSLMLSSCSETRMDLAIYHALPPIIRMPIDDLPEQIRTASLYLQSA
ncbi:MAG: hypothetical protein WBD04_06490 [Candidatus Omnitrophota bacterium]